MCKKLTRIPIGLVLICLLIMTAGQKLSAQCTNCPAGSQGSVSSGLLQLVATRVIPGTTNSVAITGPVGLCDTLRLQMTLSYAPSPNVGEVPPAFSGGQMVVRSVTNSFGGFGSFSNNLTPLGGVPKIAPLADIGPTGCAFGGTNAFNSLTVDVPVISLQSEIIGGQLKFQAVHGNVGTIAYACPPITNGIENVRTIQVSVFGPLSCSIIPQATNICQGSSASFTASASGGNINAPYTFVWAGPNGFKQTNANVLTSTITINDAQAVNAGTYTNTVTDASGCKSICTSTLTVFPPTLATPLTSLTLCPGSPATFTTVASGTGPFTYAWTKGGAPIGGATNASYSIPSVVSGDAGTYCVQVTGLCGSVTNCATLTVLTNTTATPLTSLTLCPGSTATFTTVASGTGPFTYAWTKGGAPIVGATNASYSIASVVSGDAGTYCVKVSGFCTSVTNCATLTVLTNTTATPLTSLTLCPGQNFTFATVASGSGPFTFLWLKNGLVIAGQTNSTFSLASVTANNAGVYCVVVSGACGSVTNCVTLTVNQNVSFSVLSIENGFEASGTRINYTANFSGTQLENYNWSFSDGVNISTVSSTISRLYGPFDQIPISLSVTVSGACGPGGSGTLSTPPTCGAICLRSSIGISPTYPGTDGSGTITTNYPTFSCGDFQSNSRWFFMDKLTNATGMAFISTEGSSSDTAIGVFRGIIDPTKLDYVTCGVSTNNRPARVEFETRPGISNYWLVVRTTNSGALKLTYGYQVKLTSVKTNNAIEVISTPVPSYQWRLLATTNFPSTLVTWTPLLTNNFSTNTPASSNVVRFMDTNLPGNPRRFYRLISP